MTRRHDLKTQKTKIFREHVKKMLKSLRRGENVSNTKNHEGKEGVRVKTKREAEVLYRKPD